MIIDAHAHITRHSVEDWEARDDSIIAGADALGIDQLCVSITTPSKPSTLEDCIMVNRWAAEGIARHPDRLLGYAYINPGYFQEALDEVRYCIEELGFIGIKTYNDYRCNEPVYYPLVELSIELGVPILQHAGHMHYYNEVQPRISDGAMVAELANRYPEAMIICGHIGGGGDWEWTIKALRDAPTAYADTSGSVVDEGMIEMAVEVLGADRLLFACDNSLTAGIGKLQGAQISDEDKEKIYAGNMQAILARRGE